MNRSLVAVAVAAATLALAGCGKKTEQAPPPPPPPVVLTTFQAASLVIGHADFVTGAAPDPSTTCDASTLASLASPVGPASWDGANLFVADTNHKRALAFAGIPAANGPAAAFAVGKPSLSDCTRLTDPDTDFVYAAGALPQPAGGQTTLAVADTGSDRVLVYRPAPTASDATATVVLGQADIHTFALPTCSATSVSSPRGAYLVGGRLYVADSGHHRVLVWNNVSSLTDNQPADRVFGQPDFTSCDSNQGNTSAAAGTLDTPTAVWSDGTRVAVADSGNNRVLMWGTLPTTDGAAATGVVGQGSFTTRGAGTGAAGLDTPQSIDSDGTQLAVADYGNHRVLLYPSLPIATQGAAAGIVLGQGGWMTTVGTPVPAVWPNDADQDGVEDATPSEKTLRFPSGVAFIDGALFVTDQGNDRVLVFRPATP